MESITKEFYNTFYLFEKKIGSPDINLDQLIDLAAANDKIKELLMRKFEGEGDPEKKEDLAVIGYFASKEGRYKDYLKRRCGWDFSDKLH